MKKTIMMMAVALTLLTACKGNKEQEAATTETKEVATSDSAAAEKYAVDSTSNLKWTAYKIGASHFGHIKITAGELMLKDGKIESGSFKISMGTLTAEDAKDQKDNEKLVGHLMSPDFFEVEKFAESSFEISGVTAGNNDSVTVSGNLTIKGQANNITFPAYVKVENGKLNASAKFSIDRTKWGLTYQPESKVKMKDKMIQDNIDFELTLSATK